LLGLARSSYYDQPRPESEETLALLRRLDALYMEWPFFGSRRMAMLGVNRKRVQRLRRLAGIEALQAKPRLSRPGPGHEIHPYLLRDVAIERPNQADAGRGVRFVRHAAGGWPRLGLSPKSWDLALSARLTASLLKKPSGCRKIKEPRRRTGQRSDATRAPGEVRTNKA
jgi:hypothetical protein